MKKGQGRKPCREREVSGHGQERPGQFQYRHPAVKSAPCGAYSPAISGLNFRPA